MSFALSINPWSLFNVASSWRTVAAWVSSCCCGMIFSLEQALEPLEIETRVRERRLILPALALGLGELDLEGPRVDLREEIAAMHELSLPEGDAEELAVDAAVDGDGVRGRDRSEPRESDGDVAGTRQGTVTTGTARGPVEAARWARPGRFRAK